MNNVVPNSADNTPGVYDINYVPIVDVISIPRAADNGYITDPVLLREGALWHAIRVTVDANSFDLNNTQTNLGNTNVSGVTGFVAGDEAWLVTTLQEMADYKEFLIVITDANDKKRLIGSIDHPAKFDHKLTYNGRRGYTLSFKCTSPNPPYYYQSPVVAYPDEILVDPTFMNLDAYIAQYMAEFDLTKVNRSGDTLTGVLVYDATFDLSNAKALVSNEWVTDYAYAKGDTYSSAEVNDLLDAYNDDFLKIDGTNAMAADLDFGGYTLTNFSAIGQNIEIDLGYALRLTDNSAYFSFPNPGIAKIFGDDFVLINSTDEIIARVDTSPNYVMLDVKKTSWTLQSYSPTLESLITGNTSGNISITASGNYTMKIGGATNSARFSTSLLSALRTYQYPNASGTFALLTDLSGYITTTLASGKIFVGNGSNVAAGVDLTLNATAGSFALSTAGILTMPNAATATRGLLSSTDWNTFNDKVSRAGDTLTGALIAPSYKVNGTAGNGFVELVSQSSAPAAVSGSLRLYSNSNNSFSIVRRNAAFSADITRTLSFPDSDIVVTFPTPATGGADSVAYLGTGQTFSGTNTFTPVQRFSAAGFTINDSVNNLLGWYSPSQNVMSTNFPTVSGTVFSAGTRFQTSQMNIDNNGITWSGTGVTTIATSGAYIIRSTLSTTFSTLALGGGQSTGSISMTTGAYSQNNASIGSGSVTVTTGNLTNASTVSTQSSGNIRFATGTITGGAGVMGSILQMALNYAFNVTTTPSYQSMVGGFFVGTATAVPTNNPSSGFFHYAVDLGSNVAPHYRTSAGHIIKLYSVATYTVTNPTVNRSLDVTAATHAQLCEIVGTMIADFKTLGFYL